MQNAAQMQDMRKYKQTITNYEKTRKIISG